MEVIESLLSTIVRNAPRGQPLITDPEGSIDVEGFLSRIERAAAHLLDGEASLQGRRVAILAPSSIDFVVALFGAFRAGGTAVVLSPLHPVAETSYFCDHANVDTLVVHPSLVEAARALSGSRRALSTDALAAPIATRDLVDVPLSRDALVLYTSGTTAKPKGARITHENLAIQSKLLRQAWRWSAGDRLVHALPLHHLHGLGIAMLTALSAGAAVELLPRFEAARVWEAIAIASPGNGAREPVLMGVPTMYMRLLSAFDDGDVATQRRWTAAARTLRLATSGSAAIAASLSSRWAQISGEPPLERFGMTEIGVGTSARIDAVRTPGCAGFALPTVELCVVDEHGASLPHGHEGELLVRGPSVFPGYDRDDAATRAAFTDGWFRTGDSVVLDDRGAMFVRGRISIDVLKSGGYKISALEIEEVLRAHVAVEDVAVVGVPDAEWGDLVTAVVVLRRDAVLDEATLRAFGKERLAPYKVPRRVVFVASLPRNVVGKVVKPALVQMLLAGG